MIMRSLGIFLAIGGLIGAVFADECRDALRGEIPALFSENVKKANYLNLHSEELFQLMGIRQELDMVEMYTKDPSDRFSEHELFTDGESDLIIGIDVTGNTEGHMYIGIREDEGSSYRFDGRLFFRKQGLKEKPWRLSNGLILRYRKIPENHRQLLIKFLESGAILRAPTCVASACRLLYKDGEFEGDPRGRLPWFPKTFLVHLANFGLVTSDGEKLVPEVYILNRSYKDFWNRLPTWRRVWRFLIPVLFNPKTWGLKQFDP